MADSETWNRNGPSGKEGVTSFTSNTSIVTVADAVCPGVLLARTPNEYSLISSLSNGRTTEMYPLCESIAKGSCDESPPTSRE